MVIYNEKYHCKFPYHKNIQTLRSLVIKPTFIIGKPGSGKTTLLNCLARKGFKTISCDEIVTHLYKINHAGFNALKKVWGSKYVNNEGVDKKTLWKALNQQKITLSQLNDLIHPLVEKELLKSQFDFCECPIIGNLKLNLTNFSIIKLDVDNAIALKRITDLKNISAQEAQKFINLYQDKVKTNAVFNTNDGINPTFVQKIINYTENL